MGGLNYCNDKDDKVIIYDGYSRNEAQMMTLCGRFPRTTVYSATNALFLEFLSDDIYDQGHYGFIARMSLSSLPSLPGKNPTLSAI